MANHIPIEIEVSNQSHEEVVQIGVKLNVLAKTLLEQVCKRFDYDPSEYLLVFEQAGQMRHPLDLDRTIGQNRVTPQTRIYLRDRDMIRRKRDYSTMDIDPTRSIILRSERTDKMYQVIQMPIRIGRDNPNGIDLSREPNSDTVSHDHADLFIRQGQIYIRNISNRNSVIVNNTFVKQDDGEHRLFTGDRIRLGKVTLRLNMTE